MTFFQNEPPPEDTAVPFRLIRVPAEKAIKGIVTSTDIIGARTHFAKNRTTPCPGADTCALCQDGYTWRWHAYVALLVNPGYEHAVLELTAAGSQSLRNYNELNSGVRGCDIIAHRPTKRHNGRVLVACRRIDLRGVHLPDPPNIEKILCHIWNVRYEAPKDPYRIREGSREFQLPDDVLPKVS